jgi:hypothetical protein
MMKFLPVLLVLLCSGCPKGGDLPSPAPDVQVSVEFEELVKPIVPISEPKLAAFYYDFAELLERDVDSKIIDTTSNFRKVHMNAGVLAFQKTGLKGKHPGLSEDVDTAIIGAIGIKDGPLNRKAAIDILKAISKALQ